jgi:hypothetical protein
MIFPRKGDGEATTTTVPELLKSFGDNSGFPLFERNDSGVNGRNAYLLSQIFGEGKPEGFQTEAVFLVIHHRSQSARHAPVSE